MKESFEIDGISPVAMIMVIMIVHYNKYTKSKFVLPLIKMARPLIFTNILDYTLQNRAPVSKFDANNYTFVYKFSILICINQEHKHTMSLKIKKLAYLIAIIPNIKFLVGPYEKLIISLTNFTNNTYDIKLSVLYGIY